MRADLGDKPDEPTFDRVAPQIHLAFGSAMGWTLAIRFVGIPIQIGFFALVARILSLSEFGWFAMSNAIWQASRGLGPLGFDQVALRFVPQLLMTGREQDALLLERFSRRRVLTLVGLGAGSMALGAVVLWGIGRPQDAIWCAITGLGIPAFSLGGLQAAQLRARKRVRSAQWPESVGLYVVATTGVLVLRAVGSRSVGAILAAETFAAFGACLVCAALLGIRSTPKLTEGFVELRGQVVAVAREFFVGQLATALNGRIPTLLTGVVLGAAAAGLLEVAMRIGQLGGMVTWAAGVAVSPMIAEAHVSQDSLRSQRLLTLSTLATLVPSLSIFAMVTLAGRLILAAFGTNFEAAYIPTVLIAAAAVVNASGGLAGTVLYMTGHQKTVMVWSIFGLVTLLVSGITLGSAFGIAGIAAAVLASSLVRDVGLSILLSRLTAVVAPIWSGGGLRSCRTTISEAARALSRRLHGR